MSPRDTQRQRVYMTWQPLQRAIPDRKPEGLLDGEEFVTGWVNRTYTVWEYDFGAWKHLSIKRRDQQPIHDWRHLQQIKDEIVGKGREAVELYPASDRVLDASNQYHLWVLPKGKRMAIGSLNRAVIATEAEVAAVNVLLGMKAVQRPVEEGLTI